MWNVMRHAMSHSTARLDELARSTRAMPARSPFGARQIE